MEYLSPERLADYRISLGGRDGDGSGPLRLSPNVFFFRMGSLSMLYHRLTMKVIAGGEDLMRLHSLCRAGEGILPGYMHEWEIVRIMKDQSFMSGSDEDSDEMIPFIRQMESECVKRPSTLLMETSNDCAMRCCYCDRNAVEGETMTSGEGMKAISRFFEICDSNTDLNIVITEQDLGRNWDLVQNLMAFARKRADEVRAGYLNMELRTNGLCLDEGKARILRDLGVSVQLSLDGREREHDQARRTKDGRGTFNDVLRAFGALSRSGIVPSILCRAGLHNISSLDDIVHFFVEALECREIELAFLSGSELSIPSGLAVDRALRAHEFLRRFGVKELSTLRRLRAFTDGRPVFFGCAHGPSAMAAVPGFSGPVCKALSWKKGRRRLPPGDAAKPATEMDDLEGDAITEDSERAGRVSSRCPCVFPWFDRRCRNCAALTICGGACSVLRGGEEASGRMQTCMHAQALLQWILGDLASLVSPCDCAGGFLLLPGFAESYGDRGSR